MDTKQTQALENLKTAFNISILPAFNRIYFTQNPVEFGDWMYFEQKRPSPNEKAETDYPVGTWYELTLHLMTQQQRVAFRDDLRERFTVEMGSTRLNGIEFCPSMLDRYGYHRTGEGILIPAELVDALVEQGRVVPLQDIFEKHHKIVETRIAFMNDLVTAMNTASGFPGWSANYSDLKNGPQLSLHLPETLEQSPKTYLHFDFEDAENKFREAMRLSPAKRQYMVSLNLKAHAHRDGEDGRITLNAMHDAQLKDSVDYLTGPLAPALRQMMRDIALKATPDSVLNVAGSSVHSMTDIFMNTLGPGAHSFNEVVDAFNRDPYLNALTELQCKVDAYGTCAALLADKALAPEIRAEFLKRVPALDDAALPQPASRPSTTNSPTPLG